MFSLAGFHLTLIKPAHTEAMLKDAPDIYNQGLMKTSRKNSGLLLRPEFDFDSSPRGILLPDSSPQVSGCCSQQPGTFKFLTSIAFELQTE